MKKTELIKIIKEEISGLLAENNESLQPLKVTVNGKKLSLEGGNFPLMGKTRYDLKLVDLSTGEVVQSKGGFDVNKALKELGLDPSKIKLVFTVDKPKKKGAQ
jgi:hypothetical protein